VQPWQVVGLHSPDAADGELLMAAKALNEGFNAAPSAAAVLAIAAVFTKLLRVMFFEFILFILPPDVNRIFDSTRYL
jgi:hypothetical protein